MTLPLLTQGTFFCVYRGSTGPTGTRRYFNDQRAMESLSPVTRRMAA